MKKLKLVAVLGCALALCLALVGCGGGKDSYVGTWNMQSSETIDESGTSASVYTEDEVNSLRDSGLDIYLTLKDNDIAVFNNLGTLIDGKWTASGGSGSITFDQPSMADPETGEMAETTEATLKLSGSTLIMEMENVSYTFVKSDEEKDPYVDTGIQVADENGMSLIMTESEQMSPVVIADDDTVNLTIDGVGVDSLGDPGYNLQIQNNSTNTINVWVPEPVQMDNKDIRVYTYITLNPGTSTTTFLQLDVDDAGTSDYKELGQITGAIQVDNAETGEVLGTYEFTLN